MGLLSLSHSLADLLVGAGGELVEVRDDLDALADDEDGHHGEQDARQVDLLLVHGTWQHERQQDTDLREGGGKAKKKASNVAQLIMWETAGCVCHSMFYIFKKKYAKLRALLKAIVPVASEQHLFIIVSRVLPFLSPPPPTPQKKAFSLLSWPCGL